MMCCIYQLEEEIKKVYNAQSVKKEQEIKVKIKELEGEKRRFKKKKMIG